MARERTITPDDKFPVAADGTFSISIGGTELEFQLIKAAGGGDNGFVKLKSPAVGVTLSVGVNLVMVGERVELPDVDAVVRDILAGAGDKGVVIRTLRVDDIDQGLGGVLELQKAARDKFGFAPHLVVALEGRPAGHEIASVRARLGEACIVAGYGGDLT